MKIKTSELQGAALDWAVAKCEGLPLRLDPMGFRKDAPTSMQAGWWVWDGEGQNQVIGHRKTRRGEEDGYSPSTDWAQGGPIIEREEISVWYRVGVNLTANIDGKYEQSVPYRQPHAQLTVAMRCYVASKLGDNIDIPEELK